jgi:NAD(P)-dependent dehydrogenase (short-subunit alcohol dehydrogenase family)
VNRKVLLVTGANRGLGLAVTKYFLSKNWRVYGTVRKNSDAIKLREIGADAIVCDVTDDATIAEIEQSVTQKLSLVINNAGFVGAGEKLSNTNTDDFLKQFNVHCMGALRVCQATVPILEADGLVINISSRLGSISRRISGEFDSMDCSYAYRMAKAAQNMLTASISREYIETGPRVCAVHPGKLSTSMAAPGADRTPEEAAEKIYQLYHTAVSGKLYSLFEDESTW